MTATHKMKQFKSFCPTHACTTPLVLVDFFHFTSDCFLVDALEYTKFMLVAMKKIDGELSDN
jgi:hypothetical protein